MSSVYLVISGICAFLLASIAVKGNKNQVKTAKEEKYLNNGRSHKRLNLLTSLSRNKVIANFQKQRKAKRLTESCTKDLPEMFDILTLGLSAGMSFDASLELYIERYRGDLSCVIEATMNEWKLGLKSREDALKSLGKSVSSTEIERFTTSVIEALEFGIPLSDMLVRQAAIIREEEKTKILEEVEKIPVKMLIPLGALVVPAMLLAILGPLLSGVM